MDKKLETVVLNGKTYRIVPSEKQFVDTPLLLLSKGRQQRIYGDVPSPKPKPRSAASRKVVAHLERLLYDRKLAAEACSVSVRTIDYALARGELEIRKKGRRTLITASSLKRWTNRNHYGSVKGPQRDKKSEDQDTDKAA